MPDQMTLIIAEINAITTAIQNTASWRIANHRPLNAAPNAVVSESYVRGALTIS